MKRLLCAMSIIILLVNLGAAQSTKSAGAKSDNKEPGGNIHPAAASPVTGNGTPGRIAKWVGISGSSTFVLGDTNITEDKFGQVGIGTAAPTSPLTVQGLIETTLGGYKFPDGTIQTTAVSANQVVSSLNNLKGNVTLAAGANITITPGGNTLTIAAPNALSAVAHDTTLQGNGTSASPVGVAIPLTLTGSGSEILTVINTGDSNDGVRAMGGASSGAGMRAFGGSATDASGGDGVVATGGSINGTSFVATAGVGVVATGGDSSGPGSPGFGVLATGGHHGGAGVIAQGSNEMSGTFFGGMGVQATGGISSGTGLPGGTGIVAIAGQGVNGAIVGSAGEFDGKVDIFGNLNVSGTKHFKIDHPLDPENKYLLHAAIESSEVLNIYSGNVTTNENGEATITLANWFEALNRDLRYQLTVIGTFAQAIVADKVKNNRFTIKTNAPNVEVSWQVTGVRSDAGMLKHPFKPEEEKPERERGTYINPEAFDQPEERGVEWARHPEMRRQMKDRRGQMTQKTQNNNQ